MKLLAQCTDKGWAQCDRIATDRCVVCSAPLCERCGPRILTSAGWVHRCRSGACRYAVIAAECRKAVGA